MLAVIDLRGQDLTTADLLSVVPRPQVDVAHAMDTVLPIVDAVRTRGAEAVMDFSEDYDGVRPPALRVPAEVLSTALDQLDSAVRDGLDEAIRRTQEFHRATVPPPVTCTVAPGATVSQRWVPVRRVGLYVPGGLAVYPSSVVMNVVAAQAAGVDGIAVFSPPQRDAGGSVHPTIAAACALLGVDEVYAIGGAQAIATAAYGIRGVCDPVDIVTGPGNVYVAAAKRAVNGVVGIDAEAGPTEVAIIADSTADPVLVAADLISQAEHDPLAGAVLITHDAALIEPVQRQVEAQVERTAHRERVMTALSGTQSALVLTSDIDQSIAVADAYAAEHLEIHTDDAAQVAGRIRNAGAIFVGPSSPVSLGDYVAGSNHVLPTGGTARFASGLNVTSFMKAVSTIEYTDDALAQVAQHVVALSRAENLPAHGDAVVARTARADAH